MIKYIKAEAITPVHIGSGKELNKNIEFITEGEMLGILDDKKVLSTIGKENIDQWISFIEQKKSLKSLLKQRKSEFQISDVAKRQMRFFCQDMNNVKTLKEQLHTANGNSIIPGSSLKGAIRTALFASLVKDKNKIKESLIKNKRGKFNSSQIEKSIFGKDPNHDILRFLQVGDLLFRKNGLIATYMSSMNTRRNDIELNKRVGQLTECIAQDETSELRLKIDQSRDQRNLERTGINIAKLPSDTFELFMIINQHTINLISYEINFWKEDKANSHVETYLNNLENLLNTARNLDNKECLIRVGHGSGWTFMTGNWVKDDSLVNDEIYQNIVWQARPKNKHYQEYFFPKSRRMDEDHDILGFLKLSVLD